MLRPPRCSPLFPYTTLFRSTLYTRTQCPLCHEMRAVIERVARYVPLALELIDVDTDVALAAAYGDQVPVDRKSTRLNSSHPSISYAVFCLKKKKLKQLTEAP